MKHNKKYSLLCVWLIAVLISCRTVRENSDQNYVLNRISDKDCGPEKKLYYRWGKTNVHEQWLKQSGFNGNSSPKSLGEGPLAKLSPELMTDIWDRPNDDSDTVAGPGIYLSGLSFDTKGYGEHMLIFHVSQTRSGQGVPCTREDSALLKRNAETISRERLPLIASYSHQQKLTAKGDFPWYILYRTPKPDEDIEILFSPPRLQDVDDAWNEIVAGRSRAEILHRLALELWNLRLFSVSCRGERPASLGESFVIAIYCDKTVSYLNAGKGGPALSRAELEDYQIIKKILSIKLPFDENRARWLEIWPQK